MARQAVKGPTSWADAKPPLEEAIKLDPNVGDGDHYGAAHFELAEVLLHLDDEKGALDEYTKAIQTQARHARLLRPARRALPPPQPRRPRPSRC